MKLCILSGPAPIGTGRTPHGVRGLKLRTMGARNDDGGSHPARGAWIETGPSRTARAFSSSHPARGAWIETKGGDEGADVEGGRTPHGVRGLKLVSQARFEELASVAPRTGCVD